MSTSLSSARDLRFMLQHVTIVCSLSSALHVAHKYTHTNHYTLF